MNRIDFLKRLGLGGLAIGVTAAGVKNINDVITTEMSNSHSTIIDVPEELQFHILKDDEVFHPIHKEYKVNRSGKVSYINYKNKVRNATMSKHSVTGQYGVRLKDRSYSANRFVFEAFTNTKLSQSYLIIPKDGNWANVSIDNLECIRKKEHLKYKHSNLKKTPIRNSKGQTIKWI